MHVVRFLTRDKTRHAILISIVSLTAITENIGSIGTENRTGNIGLYRIFAFSFILHFSAYFTASITPKDTASYLLNNEAGQLMFEVM